jgi:hypothetical protein
VESSRLHALAQPRQGEGEAEGGGDGGASGAGREAGEHDPEIVMAVPGLPECIRHH